MPGIDVIAGIAIIATFVIVSVATADTGALEQRMRRRGSVGESAEAMRHAQDVMDFARGGYLGVVCTPSRRLQLSGDLESESATGITTPPEPSAAVVAVATPVPGPRHLVPVRRATRSRRAGGIRAIVGTRRRAGRVRRAIRTAGRRVRATTRPPGDTR